MTGLALTIAFQLAAHSPGMAPFNVSRIADLGVDLRQEIRDIQWPKGDTLKLIARTVEPKTIALTFDDGPHGYPTIQLLGILHQLNVRATFFVVGKMVEKFPWLVREEILNGNEVGNHTYDHCNLDNLSAIQVGKEYKACSDAVERATGIRPKFCRPPGGRFDTEVLKAATDQGMWTVLWTDDPGDFAKPDPKVLIERLDRQLKNGGILLLHDGIPQTVQILPQVIMGLRQRGYRFVTCSELLAQRNRGLVAKTVKVPSPTRTAAVTYRQGPTVIRSPGR